jgi:hypothetical protein
MSEKEWNTDLLTQCIRYDDSGEIHKHEEKISQIQKEERCLRRAVWLMAALAGFALVGAGHSFILLEDLPPYKSDAIMQVFGVLGVASLISLLAFAGLLVVRRYQLGEQREQCRRVVMKLLAARIGSDVAKPRLNGAALSECRLSSRRS